MRVDDNKLFFQIIDLNQMIQKSQFLSTLIPARQYRRSTHHVRLGVEVHVVQLARLAGGPLDGRQGSRQASRRRRRRRRRRQRRRVDTPAAADDMPCAQDVHLARWCVDATTSRGTAATEGTMVRVTDRTTLWRQRDRQDDG